jgi:aspartyl-tRNA(Asn)/glutamyl-tRNA(Gln) amidotransferase subunit C
MTISKEEIKKLADLARIDLPDAEIAELVGEIDSILEYVGQIKSITTEKDAKPPPLVVRGGLGGVMNVMREDQNPTEPETHNKELIAEFPKSENNYLKVKKIL